MNLSLLNITASEQKFLNWFFISTNKALLTWQSQQEGYMIDNEQYVYVIISMCDSNMQTRSTCN